MFKQQMLRQQTLKQQSLETTHVETTAAATPTTPTTAKAKAQSVATPQQPACWAPSSEPSATW